MAMQRLGIDRTKSPTRSTSTKGLPHAGMAQVEVYRSYSTGNVAHVYRPGGKYNFSASLLRIVFWPLMPDFFLLTVAQRSTKPSRTVFAFFVRSTQRVVGYQTTGSSTLITLYFGWKMEGPKNNRCQCGMSAPSKWFHRVQT
jgi:hypothetical protein